MKLVSLNFFKGPNGLLAYREYEDGSSRGGRVTQEEAEELTRQFNEDTGLKDFDE